MIPQEILDSNKKVLDTYNVKSKLCISSFYTEDIISQLIDILKRDVMFSYVSSYNYTACSKDGTSIPRVRLIIRKSYFKRFQDEMYDSCAMYDIIDNSLIELFKERESDLIPIIGKENYNKIINKEMQISYNIYKLNENTIIIDL